MSLLLAALTSVAAIADDSHREVSVTSPNGTVRLILEIGDESAGVHYSVESDGRPIINASSIDVLLSGHGSIAVGAVVKNVEEQLIDESSALPWGKASRIRNHCREARLRLKSAGGIEWALQARAYDDGIALRYGFPNHHDVGHFAIEDENTEFRLAGNPTVLFTTCDGYLTSHEALYERKPMSELPPKKLIDKPLLAVWPDGTAAAITEARLRDFAGMYVERPAKADGNVLRTRLSPLPGKTELVAAPHWSPWRVVLLSDRAGRLIENNILLCLNDPAEGDFGWVKPGKTTFHWWNGRVEHGPPSTAENNFAIHKRYIDFCAQNHITYHSVISVAGDRPWFVQRDPGFSAPHADTDILTPRPDIDLPRVLNYAKLKGVEIRFWVHWKPLSEHLDEAFAKYEKWGIKGLMVDFMDRDDQEMVKWQEQCLRVAAKHKLHIQFHGSYKPTGEQRTFPNLFNREGVLNLEYSKWTNLCTPQHIVDVAYTRQLAGPVDFHLGGFRAVPRDKFEARDLDPVLMGTRCNQLALYVVYENPMPMLADDPSAYEGQPGFDFLVDVPTTWDETRFVAGEPGEFIVIARRSGKNWYLGGITNWTKRELSLPLTFLGEGTFAAKLYLDGSPDGRNPNEIRQERQDVTAHGKLDIALAPGGGIAAVLRPK